MGSLARSLLVVLALPAIAGARCSLPWGGNSGGDTPGPQGWTQAQTIAWYTTSQGSRLIPQAWIDALEQPDAAAPFLDPTYIETFRYLPNPAAGWVGADKSCPLDRALPLGFAVDCQSDTALSVTKLRWKTGQSDHEPWVGMNCSACHTAVLAYKGAQLRIEGGPTLADFQSFTEALDRALQHTLIDRATFTRFAARVLGADTPAADTVQLHDALARLVAWNAYVARLNAAPIRYGFGRLDAIGHIFNKVAAVATEDHPENQPGNPSDAPVSYPFLWNVPQQDKVEWNGLASNTMVGSGTEHNFDIGGLGRNAGEVIGVFADVAIKPNPGLDGYVSSLNEPHLVGMEEELGWLKPPTWPDAFPPIDQGLAKTGAGLFVSKHCDSCHTVPAIPASLSEPYKVTLKKFHSDNPKDAPTNTDMWMTCNTLLDQAFTGQMKGTKASIVTGTPFADQAYNVDMVTTAVAGALLANKIDLVATGFEGVFGINRGLPLPVQVFPQLSAKDQRRQTCLNYQEPDPRNPKLVYKSRPLQGIWATAPYLHNGSVVSLYELLLPPAQRRATFYTGTREFDPKNVGFVPDQSAENSFLFVARDAAGKPVDGNSNNGHDYGNAALTPAERSALVEYMKTL